MSNGTEEDEGPLFIDDITSAKYCKMLMIRLPMDAVKHAMKRDRIDPTIIDLDLNSKSLKYADVQNQEQGFNAGPLYKIDGPYAKYFKMLMIGLPMDVVKHTMKKDRIDSIIMDDEEKLLAAVKAEELKKLII